MAADRVTRVERARRRRTERRDALNMLAVLLLGGVAALVGVALGVAMRR